MKRVSVDTQIIILDYSKESTVYKLYYEMAETSDRGFLRFMVSHEKHFCLAIWWVFFLLNKLVRSRWRAHGWILNLHAFWRCYWPPVYNIQPLDHTLLNWSIYNAQLYTDSMFRFFNEGDMGVYGIAVLSFFSSGISVILILMCGITVSSCPAVCGFSSFWATVFDKRRSFTVLRYCSFSLSCLKQVNIFFKKNW